eukprot:6459800-Amphidinium_carterae.4
MPRTDNEEDKTESPSSRSRDDPQSDSSNGEDDDEDDAQGSKRERSESGSHRDYNIRQRHEDMFDRSQRKNNCISAGTEARKSRQSYPESGCRLIAELPCFEDFDHRKKFSSYARVQKDL